MDRTITDGIFKRRGAYITDGHIVLNGGAHSTHYFDKNVVLPYTYDMNILCRELASCFSTMGAEVVIGPETAGISMSNWTAHHMQILTTYAEKNGDDFVIKRNFGQFITDKRVLVVEDVLTTGGSVLKVINAVKAIGGNIIGLGAFCNRGRLTAEQLGVPNLYALVDVDMPKWTADDCPMCKAKIPVNIEIGHGREFVAKQNA